MLNRIIGFRLALLTVLSGAFQFYRPQTSAVFRAEYRTEERNMDQYCGVSSYVGDCGGVPTLYVNGEPFASAAYMTYIEENNDYAAFAEAGYRLFSVPVLFAGRWINSAVDGKPFHGGIFDVKGEADYSALDGSINKILAACPDAYIFPRLNISMPVWWTEEHPDCTDGTGVRESLYSEAYRQTAVGMLRDVIAHIVAGDYAPHIVGYQIAGGNTEEWFHFDLNAGYCKNAESAFNAYLQEYYPGCGFSGLPDLSLLQGRGNCHKNEHLARYLEFASNAVADDICYFCAAAKNASGGNVVVGTFYGYALEVTSSLYGAHALNTVLACDAVDFICSPNSYIGVRDADTDWTEMYAADSVRLHGKLCMQECDIRTHLTRLLADSAPGYDTQRYYTAPIWQPLESREKSVSMLRKSFARQLIRGNGFWWFDMWGGWYRDPDLLSELRQMREIYADSLTKPNRAGTAEIAVFVDESAYKYYTDCALRGSAFNQRAQLGLTGAPYDLFDVADFEAVYKNYKGIVFLSELKTDAMKNALALCKRDRVKYISVSSLKKAYSAAELRAFCASCGAHVYCETDCIVYVNQNYLAVHAAEAGTVTIRLKETRGCRELLAENGLRGEADTLVLSMQAGETKLFELL